MLWAPGVLSPGERDWGMKLITQLRLVPRLRMSGAISSDAARTILNSGIPSSQRVPARMFKQGGDKKYEMRNTLD
jgi:hypothetical protein